VWPPRGEPLTYTNGPANGAAPDPWNVPDHPDRVKRTAALLLTCSPPLPAFARIGPDHSPDRSASKS